MYSERRVLCKPVSQHQREGGELEPSPPAAEKAVLEACKQVGTATWKNKHHGRQKGCKWERRGVETPPVTASKDSRTIGRQLQGRVETLDFGKQLTVGRQEVAREISPPLGV